MSIFLNSPNCGERRRASLQVPAMEEQGEADAARGAGEVQECRRRPQRYALLLPVHPHGGGHSPQA